MDWISFFHEYSIEYVEKGPNVSRGNINIRCPFCGSADESHHLGVSLSGKGYGCWRNSTHRGKNPAKLIQALLQCSWEQASRIAGYDSTYIPEDFSSKVNQYISNMSSSEDKEKDQVGLSMPKEFLPLANTIAARLFMAYLRKRKYTTEQILKMHKRFDIRYCKTGPFRNRIIFPIYFENKLVSWTGRAISPDAVIRYKTLSPNKEKAQQEGTQAALGPIGNYMLWYDKLLKTKAHTLCLVEGPFDALRVWTIGRKMGVVATCFFTNAPSEKQIELMHDVFPRFKRTVIIPDQGAFDKALTTQSRLAVFQVPIINLPEDIDDPGDLPVEILGKILA